jgi:hypothetical protein
MFSNLSEKPQEGEASSAAWAVFVLSGMWVENVTDEPHALITNPMTLSEVV